MSNNGSVQATGDPILMGIDGCKGGWIAAVDRGSQLPLSCERFDSIEHVMKCAPHVVAIDIPIGLLDCGCRVCDVEARSQLGARRSSVFTAPIRPVLSASSHDDACLIRWKAEGKRISRQAWAIVEKVEQIDSALRTNEAWRSIIREVHPELCFQRLNNDRALAHGKKRPAGRRERLDLLRPVFGSAVDEVLADRKHLACANDDVIDAFVALWTARRIAQRTAVPVPARPLADPHGITMQMWA